MKSLSLRIVLVALIATTYTSTVYSLPFLNRAICATISATMIAGGCLGIVISWNYHNIADSDMNTVKRVNKLISVVETEMSKKPAFCKLEGVEREEVRKIYVEAYGEDKARAEENEYAKLSVILVNQKAQAPMWLRAKAMLKAAPIMVTGFGCLALGSWMIKDIVTR